MLGLGTIIASGAPVGQLKTPLAAVQCGRVGPSLFHHTARFFSLDSTSDECATPIGVATAVASAAPGGPEFVTSLRHQNENYFSPPRKETNVFLGMDDPQHSPTLCYASGYSPAVLE